MEARLHKIHVAVMWNTSSKTLKKSEFKFKWYNTKLSKHALHFESLSFMGEWGLIRIPT